MLLIRNKPLRLTLGLLETFNFLQLKLWLKNPALAKALAGKQFRTYMSLVKRDRWRCLSIDEIFPTKTGQRIELEHLPGVGIATPIEELAYLALIARNVQPNRIFEIGTFRGRTALNFARNSPPECQVLTMDLPLDDREAMRAATNPDDDYIISASQTGVDYRGKPGAEKIHQLFGDSTKYDFTPYLGQMDIVFVDGAHHYEAAASDTRNALKMVRDGGWIIWHDFANYGDYNDVTRAVLDLLPASEVIQIDDTQLAVYQKRSGNR